MSTISNSARKSNPTGDAASKKNMGGANPTYKTHVQKHGEGITASGRETAKDSGKRKTAMPPNPDSPTVKSPVPRGFGDGHYIPAK